MLTISELASVSFLSGGSNRSLLTATQEKHILDKETFTMPWFISSMATPFLLDLHCGSVRYWLTGPLPGNRNNSWTLTVLKRSEGMTVELSPHFLFTCSDGMVCLGILFFTVIYISIMKVNKYNEHYTFYTHHCYLTSASLKSYTEHGMRLIQWNGR